MTAPEKKLGNNICELVREVTPHEPYFADQQSSLGAFTKNILGALHRAIGLIAIMHPRGTVRFPSGTEHTRASVWIEQEIAIAAFVTQILGRPLKVAAFVHSDINREGMREQLQLNPVVFSDDAEVLKHLRGILAGWGNVRASPGEQKQVGSPLGDIQGPELVIEYSDSEGAHSDPNTSWPASLGRDIKIRNLSKYKNAYNVEVKDLVTPDGSAIFAPSVVAFIPAEGEAKVSPDVRDVSPIVRRSIAALFARSYKNSSTDELMGEKSYWLTMEYDDGNGNRFEVKCELLYIQWKRIVRTGRVNRRRL